MTNLKVTCFKISCYLNISLVLREVFPPILVLLIYRTISISKWIKAILRNGTFGFTKGFRYGESWCSINEI